MMPGGGELLIVLLMVFLLFGGRELPRIARTLGKWSAVMKRSLNDVRREFNRISIEEELREAGREVGDFKRDPLGLSTPNPGVRKPTTRREEVVVEADAGPKPDVAPGETPPDSQEPAKGGEEVSSGDTSMGPPPEETRIPRGAGGSAAADEQSEDSEPPPDRT